MIDSDRLRDWGRLSFGLEVKLEACSLAMASRRALGARASARFIPGGGAGLPAFLSLHSRLMGLVREWPESPCVECWKRQTFGTLLIRTLLFKRLHFRKQLQGTEAGLRLQSESVFPPYRPLYLSFSLPFPRSTRSRKSLRKVLTPIPRASPNDQSLESGATRLPCSA